MRITTQQVDDERCNENHAGNNQPKGERERTPYQSRRLDCDLGLRAHSFPV